jgi:hypothetical protein
LILFKFINLFFDFNLYFSFILNIKRDKNYLGLIVVGQTFGTATAVAVGRQTAAGCGSEPVVAGENLHSAVLVGAALGPPVVEALGPLAEAAGSKKSKSVVAAAEPPSVDLSTLTVPRSTTLPSEVGPLDLRTHTGEAAD